MAGLASDQEDDDREVGALDLPSELPNRYTNHRRPASAIR